MIFPRTWPIGGGLFVLTALLLLIGAVLLVAGAVMIVLTDPLGKLTGLGLLASAIAFFTAGLWLATGRPHQWSGS